MPFGANAKPPTVERTSSACSAPLAVCAKACLPADQASAPLGPAATWSIQRRLASVAITLHSPSTPVATTLPSSPPVTTRSASALEQRIAPPWAATVRDSPVRGTRTSASSPSTRTATSPRKCAPTTPAPALTGRVRSTTEGISLRASVTASQPALSRTRRALRRSSSSPQERTRLSRHAARKSFPDLLLRQLAADEDDAAFAFLAVLPGALVIAVEDHVQALEHETRGVVLERQDALAAQNARPLLLHEILHPGEELVGVERLVGLERHRMHLLVVIMLQAAAIVVVMMMAVTVAVLVIMLMTMIVLMVVVRVPVMAVTQKLGLDLQDAVEIEGVAPEHLRQRNAAALGPVQLGVGIDAADARLHLAELVGRHEVGFVDEDHVGERDLILGLGRVLEPILQPFGVGHRHDGIELGLAADILVHEERLRHRRRIGEPGGLDDDGVELTLPPHQPVDDAHEVATHGAADAAVVHLEHLLVGAHHEVVVDSDLPELVDDHGVLLAVLLGQDAVEQRRLAGAEIAGQHGDGDLVGHRSTPFEHRIYASVVGCYRPRLGRVGRATLGEEPMGRMSAAFAAAAIGVAEAALTLVIVAGVAQPAAASRATLNLVLVLDGLLPDAITPEETPNLWRLRQEGVNFLNGHAVFPTVTRVNATAIATGTYPARNGIFGNRIYVRAVDPNSAFNNDDHRNLLRLDEVTGGAMVLAKSLGEILTERGKRLAAVSSGSTGQVLLLNPRAPKGVGMLIIGYWEPGQRVAFPDTVNNSVLQRFGPVPARGGATASDDPAVAWTQGVLRDYVLTELKADVVINWLTEPDHIQHIFGAGSPQ